MAIAGGGWYYRTISTLIIPILFESSFIINTYSYVINIKNIYSFVNLCPGIYTTTYTVYPKNVNDVGQISNVQRKIKYHHGFP